MNRGFKTYYKEGIESAFLTLKKKENFIKYYLHLFMNLFGRILFALLSPAFDLSMVRLAKMVRKHKKIEVASTFESSNKARVFWTALMATILVVLMCLAGVMIFAFAEGLVVLLGVTFDYLGNFSQEVGIYTVIFLSIPVAIGLIVYCFLFPLYFAPLIYVVDTVEDIGASVAVSKSIEAMKHNGKRTFFVTNLITSLINFGYLTVASLVIFGLLSIGETVAIIFAVLFFLAFVAGYILFAPVINLGSQIACVSLFEDIVFDKYNENKVAKGVYVKGGKSVKATVENYQDKLIRMFDEVEDVDLSLLNMRKVQEINIPKKEEKEIKEVHKILEYSEDDLKQLMKENSISLNDESKVVYEEETKVDPFDGYESVKEEEKVDTDEENKDFIGGIKKKVSKSIRGLLYKITGDEDYLEENEESVEEDTVEKGDE